MTENYNSDSELLKYIKEAYSPESLNKMINDMINFPEPEMPLSFKIKGGKGFETYVTEDNCIGIMPKWISVTNEQPPEDRQFLATDGKECHVVLFENDYENFITGSGESCYYCGGYGTVSFEGNKHKKYYKTKWSFTHWMELPEMPNE